MTDAKPALDISFPEDDTMYALMKEMDDFESFPIPSHWFKKYGIKPREAVNPREFIQSGYTQQCAFAPKDLSPIIIDKPQRDGFTWKLQEVEEVKAEIVERLIEQKED